MAKSIFDYWKDLTQLKVPLEEENTYNPYQMTRLVSMFQMCVPFAEEVARYQLPKETHYDLLSSFLPKRFLKIDYMKKKKDEADYALVSRYFEFGSRDLKLALSILTDDEINIIKKKYGGLER